MRLGEVLRSIDWVMLGAASLLVMINLAMLFSSAFHEGSFVGSRFSKQLLAFGISAAIAIAVARLPYHSFKPYVFVFFGLGVSLLLLVSVSGGAIKGAISRFSFGGFQLQPSEFIKISLVLVVAWLIDRRAASWRLVFISAIFIGLPVILIALEPDIGVASLIMMFWGVMLIYSGLSRLILIMLGLSGSLGAWMAWLWVLRPYQKARLLIFLNPLRDPLGAGYNIVQSIVAFGSGRILGRGIGYGPQSQLQFLPERHTDFILASVGEELGFSGVVLITVLYFIVLWRIFSIARTTRDSFGRALCTGAFVFILISFVVSAAMNMGLLPVTGIPMPFVSYGGSNLLSTFMLLGIVQSVRVYSKWVQAPPIELSEFS